MANWDYDTYQDHYSTLLSDVKAFSVGSKLVVGLPVPYLGETDQFGAKSVELITLQHVVFTEWVDASASSSVDLIPTGDAVTK